MFPLISLMRSLFFLSVCFPPSVACQVTILRSVPSVPYGLIPRWVCLVPLMQLIPQSLFYFKHPSSFCSVSSLRLDVVFLFWGWLWHRLCLCFIRSTWTCWGALWFWQATWPSRFSGPMCIRMLWWVSESAVLQQINLGEKVNCLNMHKWF